METQAPQNAFQASVNVVEVVTDASSTIKKLPGKQYCTWKCTIRTGKKLNPLSQWFVKFLLLPLH